MIPDVWRRPVEGKPRERLIRVVFVGTLYDEKRRPVQRFARLTFDDSKVNGMVQGELGSELHFSPSKKGAKIKSPGTVYDVVEVTDDAGKITGWRISTPTYVGRYGPGGDVVEAIRWEAEQVARDAARDAAAKMEKAQADSPLSSALETLRTAYRSQVGANRAQLLAFIVKEITK